MSRFGLQIEMKGMEEAEAKLAKMGVEFKRKKYLTLIGMRLLNWSDENFRQEGSAGFHGWRRLRPNTKAGRRGGGGKVLQDTGRLKQSFVYNVSFFAGSVAMGSPDKRSLWHHLGTRPYPITPKRRKMLRFPVVGGIAFARKVNHPGLPRRPLLPTRRAGTMLAMEVLDAYVESLVAGAN